MKIIGLTRVRNESEIMQETLDHMAEFCDAVYVYDDASTDNTVEICKNHKIVKGVIENKVWGKDRALAEYKDRQAVLQFARAEGYLKPEDWFIYMDADERIEFDFNRLKSLGDDIGGIRMRLFDFYITEEDLDKKYYEREYMGPEYRDILFMFRNKNAVGYSIPDQRECTIRGGTIREGYVKHYGKSISVQQWEDTCDYYGNHFPKYSKKWLDRKGKAIHTKSDFNRPLIKWEDRFNDKIITRI